MVGRWFISFLGLSWPIFRYVWLLVSGTNFWYTLEYEHETWEYTPGKGKSSSKPASSGSMLLFGGVYLQIPSKRIGLQRSPNKSGSFWKKSGQEVSLEQRPDAPRHRGFWRFGSTDTCTGWCWRVGLAWIFASECQLVHIFCVCLSFFQWIFPQFCPSFFFEQCFLRSTCENGGKKRCKACDLRTYAGSMWCLCRFVVTQDLVQVLTTAWDEFVCRPSDTDLDGHFGLAKCKCFESQVQLQQEVQCGTVEMFSWWRCIILAGWKPSYPVTIDTDQRFFGEDIRNIVGAAARQAGLHSWCSTRHLSFGIFAVPSLFSCGRQRIQKFDGCRRWHGHWWAVQSPPWNSARCHFHGHWRDFGQCEWRHLLLAWLESFWTFDFSHTGGLWILLLSVQAKQLGFGTTWPQRSCRKSYRVLLPKTRSKWAAETRLEEWNPSDAAGRGFPYRPCSLQRPTEVWAGVACWNCFQWCRGRLPICFASNVHAFLHGAFEFPSRSLQHLRQHCVHYFFILQYGQGPERDLFRTSSKGKGRATSWRTHNRSAESAAEPRCFCPNLCSSSYWHQPATSSWYDSKLPVLPAYVDVVRTAGHWDNVQVVFWVAVILCRRCDTFHCAGIFVTANAGGNWGEIASTASHPSLHNHLASNGTCWWLNPCLVQHSHEPTKATPLHDQFYNCRCLRFLCGCHHHSGRSSLEVPWRAPTASRKFSGLW